jgi:hypothetical protein
MEGGGREGGQLDPSFSAQNVARNIGEGREI